MLKKLGERIFRFYCHPEYQEDIIGDLEEHYDANIQEAGIKYADKKFLIDVLLLFRISLLRDTWISQNQTTYTMVKSNLKVAYRNMMRHKFYTFLNLVGLAVSLAACIFISIYVKDELSYDKHFPDSERIFRIAAHLKFGNNEFNIPAVPDPMGATMKQDFPEVEMAGRVRGNSELLVSVGGEQNYHRVAHISWADQEWLELFGFTILRGNPEHLLDEPNTVVLSESTSRQLFGDTDPIGKTINVNDDTDLQVTGVVADIPENSHFQYNMFITMLNMPGANRNFWLSNNFITYLKLNAPASEETVQAKIPDFVLKYFGEQVSQMSNRNLEESLASGAIQLDYFLQPISKIHLFSSLDGDVAESGSIDYIYIFSIIGFFILLIACINFMNMATARASVRAKEVGVRKVLGSLRKQLISQFLTESLLNSIIAFAVAIGLFYLLLPSFNQLIDKNLTDPIFGAGGLWPYLILGCFVVGLLAGIYPAFVLSSFRPARVLKGEMNSGRRASWMRNILVVIQFTTSIALIIGSMIVYNQLNYLQNKELGFNKDQVLLINETQLLGEQIEVFRTALKSSPAIEEVSISGYVPASNIRSDAPYLSDLATSSDESVSMQVWMADDDYASTYELELVEGRFFSQEFPSDSSSVVINQTAANRLGYIDGAVGRSISLVQSGGQDSPRLTIVGVVKDFHFQSMRANILPQVFYYGRSTSGVSIRFRAGNTVEALAAARRSWDELSNGRPFDYVFLQDRFLESLANEDRVRIIFTAFAVLAVTIACLGLFGLAAYVTEQRKKEIGIRKVLGATNYTLLNLLFRNFTKLIVISSLIAVPLAWWYMDGWLADFPFNNGLSPITFVVGAVGTLLIAWITVGYQSMKAARRNPVDNLRTE